MIGGSAAAAVATLAHSTRPPFAMIAGGASSEEPRTMGSSRPLAAIDPRLLKRALTALDRHGSDVKHWDRIAIVDFSAPSSQARLHILDVDAGRSTRFLVAHGSGIVSHRVV
jgi:hypothetical protein